MSIEQHYPKPRRRHSHKSKRSGSSPPVPEPIVPERFPIGDAKRTGSTPPAQNPTEAGSERVFSDADLSGQVLPESIEIFCPVCSWGLSLDETGQTSCEECDYVEAGEFDY